MLKKVKGVAGCVFFSLGAVSTPASRVVPAPRCHFVCFSVPLFVILFLFLHFSSAISILFSFCFPFLFLVFLFLVFFFLVFLFLVFLFLVFLFHIPSFLAFPYLPVSVFASFCIFVNLFVSFRVIFCLLCCQLPSLLFHVVLLLLCLFFNVSDNKICFYISKTTKIFKNILKSSVSKASVFFNERFFHSFKFLIIFFTH